MNAIDMLLKANKEDFDRETKVVEIKRLSKKFGYKFELLCKGLYFDKYNEVQKKTMKIKGKDPEFDIFNMQLELAVNGVFNVEDGSRFFSNKELQEHFKCHTMQELAKKILTAGEIDALGDMITELSGFKDKDDLLGGTVEEIMGL